jgi:hypothetical protein
MKQVQILVGKMAGFMCWLVYDQSPRVGSHGAGMWVIFLHLCSSVRHSW